MKTRSNLAASSFLDDLNASRQTDATKPLVLAPIATIGHPGFRSLIQDFHPPRAYWTEMISAEALAHQGTYEEYYLDPQPTPDRLIVQLLWRDSNAAVLAAGRIHDHLQALQVPWIGLDLNMGCSAPQIIRAGAGAAWMQHPDQVAQLVSRLREILPNNTLSVKLRLGPTEDPQALVTLGQNLQQAGVDFLTLHPRTQKQGYNRPARWQFVQLLQNELTIPVIGNGDILTPEAILQKNHISCSGLMVGRAVIQQPWFFLLAHWQQIEGPIDLPGDSNLLRKQNRAIQVNLEETATRFHRYLELFQPQDFWPTRTKRFYSYFTQNLTFGHRLGATIQNLRDYRAMQEHFFDYLTAHPEHRWKTIFLETEDGLHQDG